MSNIPAFPRTQWPNETGMSLRDYFASQAMQGMLSACTGWSESDQERLAKCSYKMADEMMKARNKQ